MQQVDGAARALPGKTGGKRRGFSKDDFPSKRLELNPASHDVVIKSPNRPGSLPRSDLFANDFLTNAVLDFKFLKLIGDDGPLVCFEDSRSGPESASST